MEAQALIQGLHISAGAIISYHYFEMDILKISQWPQEGGRETYGTELSCHSSLSHHHSRLLVSQLIPRFDRTHPSAEPPSGPPCVCLQ